MMPYDMLTKDFIKELLVNKKALLKMKYVNFIKAPAYDELSVKSLY